MKNGWRGLALLSMAVGLLVARPVQAQWAPEPRFTQPLRSTDSERILHARASALGHAPSVGLQGNQPITFHDDAGASSGAMLLGGVAGGALGLVAGAYLGQHFVLEELGGSEYVPGGLLIGAAVGEIIGLPLGVHLANGRRSNYRRNALLSAGVFGVGALLTAPTSGISLLLVLPVQLGIVVGAEQKSSQGPR